MFWSASPTWQARLTSTPVSYTHLDVYKRQSKGKADKPPASDYTKLIDSVDKPEEKYATSFKGDDLAAWTVVQGPSKLLLFLTVYKAGTYAVSYTHLDVYKRQQCQCRWPAACRQ